MKSILILEDCPLLQLLYRKSIEIHLPGSVNCTTATYVAQAKELVKTNRFDLHVLDFNLPDGKSDEFLQYCKLSRIRTPSIIISSEDKYVLERKLSSFSNIHSIHEKPLGIVEFVSLIKECFSPSNKYQVDSNWKGDTCNT